MAETAKSNRRTQASSATPASSGQPPQTKVVDAKANTTARPLATEKTNVAPPVPPVEPPTKREPEASPRRNVSLNSTTVALAFKRFTSSRSVRHVQLALEARGFPPDDESGNVTFDTRAQYADFQRSIDEEPTGIPTSHSLNLLGFDVIG